MFFYDCVNLITIDFLIVYFISGCIFGALFKIFFEFTTLYKVKGFLFICVLLWPLYYLVIFSVENKVGFLKNITWRWIPVSYYTYNEYMLTMGVLWLPKVILIILGWLFVVLYICFILVKMFLFVVDTNQ